MLSSVWKSEKAAMVNIAMAGCLCELRRDLSFRRIPCRFSAKLTNKFWLASISKRMPSKCWPNRKVFFR